MTTALILLAYFAGVGTVLFFIRKRGTSDAQKAADEAANALNSAGHIVGDAVDKAKGK